MTIVHTVKVKTRKIRGVTIVYPDFLHFYGLNKHHCETLHTYRGSFAFHIALERILLTTKSITVLHLSHQREKWVPVFHDLSEFLLGLNCAYPMRDVLLYLLWIRRHYGLRSNYLIGSHFVFFKGWCVYASRRYMTFDCFFENPSELVFEEIRLLYFIFDHFMLADEALNLSFQEDYEHYKFPYTDMARSVILYKHEEHK